MTRILVISLGLTLLACRTPTDSYRELLDVNATLDPGERIQHVMVDRSFRVDDSVGAITVHGCCGVWGALSVGLLADGSYRLTRRV